MLATTPPLVIERTSTIKVGEERLQRNTLKIDVSRQGLADVRWIIREITARETALQIRLRNPPSLVEVDRRTNKSPEDVDKIITVTFGTALPELAMRLVESELRHAIEATTKRRTGRLAGIGSSWQWTLVQDGRARRVSAGQPIGAFGPQDYLILSPEAVPYATLVNMRVAGGGRLSIKTRGKKGKVSTAKSNQHLGFLAYAARQVKRKTAFQQFAVFVSFTQAYKVPGELSRKQGTGVLMIRARRRLGSGRRR